ncbi:hypothetical protein [Thermospira aquatica]|uniref:Outer membrane protein beta-barrel domain-containing protein n=1 Tax=Thermospira aquatica TaxID=2828656 RepID=A0AAX3BFZ3_9SPIR|nr:hypothetical protein [Thermospira aquatica]URA11190.1 hypothetical protein KDW03_05190 [Thermospira aquatica]
MRRIAGFFLFLVGGFLWSIMSAPMLMPVSPGENIVYGGINEFLYLDQLEGWNIPEIGYKRGINEQWAIGIRTWRVGLLGELSYVFLGNPNSWFRCSGVGGGGFSYSVSTRQWEQTAEMALGFDVALARPIRAYFSTGWRFLSSTTYPFWRMSASLWIRWRSVVFLPEISLVRFAQFDPSLPPFYFNPGIAIGFSW